MSFSRWLQNLRSALIPGQRHPRRGGSLRAGTHRPRLEVLEDRVNPSFDMGFDFGYPGVPAPPLPLVADFTSDGILDQLSTSAFDVIVRPGRGDGTFGDPIASPYPPGLLAAADFNADGRLDLFSAYPNFDGTDSSAGVALGRGDGTFLWIEGYFLGSAIPIPSRIETGNLALTGRTDVRVVAVDYEGVETSVVLYNDGIWPSLPRSLRIGDVTVAEGNSGSVAATFTVTLSPGSETVTVAYATGNGSATAGSDYHSTSGTLTFAPGELSKTVTVLVTGDRLPESNETFVVNLSNPTNATIADGQAVGTIVDDEPRVSISDVSKAEGKRGQTTLFTFTVTLSSPFVYDQPVTMSYQTANGTARTSDNDYVARSGTLTFAPGETSKTVTIEVKGDSKREGNETFYLDLFGLSGNALFTRNRGTGTILNDD